MYLTHGLDGGIFVEAQVVVRLGKSHGGTQMRKPGVIQVIVLWRRSESRRENGGKMERGEGGTTRRGALVNGKSAH